MRGRWWADGGRARGDSSYAGRGAGAHTEAVATHEPVGPPLQTGTQLSSVAFSADGDVAAAGEDGTVWLWTGLFWRDADELESIVCPLVGGGFSEAEWDRYASAIPYRNSCD